MHWACIGHALVDQVIAPTSVTVFQQLFPSSNSRSSSAYHMPRPFLLRTSPAFDVARLPGVVVLVCSSSFVVCRSLFVVRSFVRSFVRCWLLSSVDALATRRRHSACFPLLHLFRMPLIPRSVHSSAFALFHTLSRSLTYILSHLSSQLGTTTIIHYVSNSLTRSINQLSTLAVRGVKYDSVRWRISRISVVLRYST